MARIAQEIGLVKWARRTDSAGMRFDGGFIWPVEGPISGVYGSQRILNGKPRQPHYGIDIADDELRAQAVEWAMTRGARNGRVAWQFIQDLAGRQGVRID